jgi:hypothetical protein
MGAKEDNAVVVAVGERGETVVWVGADCAWGCGEVRRQILEAEAAWSCDDPGATLIDHVNVTLEEVTSVGACENCGPWSGREGLITHVEGEKKSIVSKTYHIGLIIKAYRCNPQIYRGPLCSVYQSSNLPHHILNED